MLISKINWAITYYSDDVQDAILALPAGLQARYIHLTQRMEEFGPDLGMPHTSGAMGKGLFELRTKSKEGIARVFFCLRANPAILMLHAFIKKSNKTPVKELKIARSRYLEVVSDDDS